MSLTERALRSVLDGEVEVVIALQPIVSLHDGSVLGHEALFRAPQLSSVTPPALWRLAASMGMVDALEDRVAAVCARLSPVGYLFVNADARAHGIAERYRRIPRVVVELTEAAPVRDTTVRELRRAGIPYALDDLGVGEANLAALVRLRPDFVKIDRAIVDAVDRDDAKAAIVQLLVAYAQRTSTRVIAEGVERAAEAERLRRLGVPYGQGYWFGRPIIVAA
jgi:EAL domain-containing protein (putative c-di-GMP-specific phosphodiesterase class I)